MSTESQHKGAKISSDQWEVPRMLLASPGTTTVSMAMMAVGVVQRRDRNLVSRIQLWGLIMRI